ncbi:VWFA and cache domain-containing protein 1-like isoform X2 [Lineus longissimus]|uniref:VWFA and cache domain-containing protein 1-like isoform X2 n=1 Tax=Lineus longissimus TaxID=88925 RepID=UPI00315CEF23
MTRSAYLKSYKMCPMLKSVHFILTVILSVICLTSAVLDGGNLREDLDTMMQQGLGVQAWQDYFDTLSFTADIPKGQTLLNQIAAKLSSKFTNRVDNVIAQKDFLQSKYGSFSSNANSLQRCCTSWGLSYDEQFKMNVNTRAACYAISSTTEYDKKFATQSVINRMISNRQQSSELKWQYFGDENGILTMFPANNFAECGSYDPRYRPWYVAAATPTKKEVVVVIDKSGSMGNTHSGITLMEIAKNAADTVLETLGPDDLVGVVAFSTNALTESGCYSDSLAAATPINVKKLKDYIKTLYQGGGTSYVSALDKAFSLFKKKTSEITREKVILFLTDGAPYESQIQILNKLKVENAALSNKVVILTYGLGRNLDSGAQNILRNMAKQTGYDPSAGSVKEGLYTAIENPSKLRSSMATYYNFFSKATNNSSPVISVPYFDAFGLGMIMTVSLPFYYNNKLTGVVGLDIPLSDLFAEAIFSRHYIFVTDSRGRAILHPLLPQPDKVSSDPIVAKIGVFERGVAVSQVLDSMKSGGSGSKNLTSDHIIANGNSFRDGVTTQKLQSTYFWKQVNGSSFSVCLVMVKGDVEAHMHGLSPTDKFWYHRIDIKVPSPTCKHFNRISTQENSVVKLAAECFTSPYKYLDDLETNSSVSALTNYLTYKTSSNPGLKPDIRDTVTLLAKGDDIWLKQLTEMAQYLAWRYIATFNGVFRITPGVKLQKAYNAARRPWYQRAMSHPGRIVISAPYLDAFGAGYVVTLSYTLYKGDSSKQHSSSDTVIAVAGGDFTLGYFYQTFINKFPKCKEQENSCFLFDSSGYVVIHEDFVKAKTRVLPEVEDVHITVKDAILARYLIDNVHMVRQKCLGITDRDNLSMWKRQSTWKVDLGVKTYLTFDRSTVTYEVSAVTGSNVFVVLKNPKVTGIGCSCSVKSADSYKNYKCRITLSNNPKVCECPCYSDADYQYCDDKLTIDSSTSPPCTAEIQPLNVTQPSKSERDIAKALSYCYQKSCTNVNSEGLCISLLGCSWCARASDGGILQKPYCASSEECYLGVVGMPSPYNNGGGAILEVKGRPLPLAEIIGGIVGVICLIIIIAIAVKCCQRHRAMKNRPYTERRASSYINTAMAADQTEIAVELSPSAPAVVGQAQPPYNPHHDVPPSYEDTVGYPGVREPPWNAVYKF